MCGMVVTLDNAVGEVVDALREQSMFENTLIIFHSDVTLPTLLLGLLICGWWHYFTDTQESLLSFSDRTVVSSTTPEITCHGEVRVSAEQTIICVLRQTNRATWCVENEGGKFTYWCANR